MSVELQVSGLGNAPDRANIRNRLSSSNKQAQFPHGPPSSGHKPGVSRKKQVMVTCPCLKTDDTTRELKSTVTRDLKMVMALDVFGLSTVEPTNDDNDNDNDHSFSQLPVHKALTCPKGQSAWAVATSTGWRRKLAQC